MLDLTRLVGKQRLGYGQPEVRNLEGPKTTLHLRGLPNVTPCATLPSEVKELYHSYTIDKGPVLPRSTFIETEADVASYCRTLDALKDAIIDADDQGYLPPGLKEVELDNLEKAGLRSGHRRFFYADRAGQGPAKPARKVSRAVWNFMAGVASRVKYEPGLQKAKRSSNLGYPLWVPGTHPMNPTAAIMSAKVASALNSGLLKPRHLSEMTDWQGIPCFTLFMRAKDDRKFRPDYNLSPDGFTATTESRWAYEYVRKISAGPGIVNLGQKRLQKTALQLLHSISITRTETRVELGARLTAYRRLHLGSKAVSVDVSAFDESITRELRSGAEQALSIIAPSDAPCYEAMQEMPLLLPPCFSGPEGAYEFYRGARIRSGEAGTMFFSSYISLGVWIEATCRVLRLTPEEAYTFLENKDLRGPIFLKIKGDDWAVETSDDRLLSDLLAEIAALGLKTDQVPGFVLLMDFYPPANQAGSAMAYGLVSRAMIQTEARERQPASRDLELLGLYMRWARLNSNPLQRAAFDILRSTEGFARLFGMARSEVVSPGSISLVMAKSGCFSRLTQGARSSPYIAQQVLESAPGYHDVASDSLPADLLVREMFSLASESATWDVTKASSNVASGGELVKDMLDLAKARKELSNGDWALESSVYGRITKKLERQGLLEISYSTRRVSTQFRATKNIKNVNYTK